MSMSWVLRRFYQIGAGAVMFVWFGSVSVADLNPAAISIQMPNQIKWISNGNGAEIAKLVGDPAKPGWYVYLNKWTPNHMSRPHFHQYDRYITVLSGTWWVGTGNKYDPDSTVPVPAGSFVTHFAKQIHYDGAKDVECVLEIAGQGPAASTPAEVK